MMSDSGGRVRGSRGCDAYNRRAFHGPDIRGPYRPLRLDLDIEF
jgi:hypothetical protein